MDATAERRHAEWVAVAAAVATAIVKGDADITEVVEMALEVAENAGHKIDRWRVQDILEGRVSDVLEIR